MIKISLPCSECGCDFFEGVCTKDGACTFIQVCACDSGDGYYNIHIIKNYQSENEDHDFMTYKSKEEAEALLNACFTSSVQIHHCK